MTSEPILDYLYPFAFDNLPVRGAIVKLDASYREILNRHPYPKTVQQFLGQALASVALLSATLKQQGSLILQAQGNGPLSLLLAQAKANQEIRGLAKWTSTEDVPEDFMSAVGAGKLALTITSGAEKNRYQGVVALTGENLARVIENYFCQSEQLPTLLFLAANGESASGLLLQLLPENSIFDEAKAFWEHISCFAKTLTSEELLQLDPRQILHRLFHEETLRLFPSKVVNFICHCSREAMVKAILTLGYTDAIKLVIEQNGIAVTCEFCNKRLDFDEKAVEQMFNMPDANSLH